MDKADVKKIEEFVRKKPRTIQEVSELIGKSWVTTNRIVEKISKEEGSIEVRTFRGGTRGALKIVYSVIDSVHATQIQERLLKIIENGRNKEDFSPSEIFQFVDDDKKKAYLLDFGKFESEESFNTYKNILLSAESQILFFSGNLTFSNLSLHDKKIKDVLLDFAERKGNVKVLTRVEVPGTENVKELIAINDRVGRNVVEVRHCFQPVRGTIVDSKVALFKETRFPKDFYEGELDKPFVIAYEIYDTEWIEWIQKVFYHLFRGSVDANKRIKMFEDMYKKV